MLQKILLLWWEVGPDVGFFSNLGICKLLDLGFNGQGTLWIPCKYMDRQMSRTEKKIQGICTAIALAKKFIHTIYGKPE